MNCPNCRSKIYEGDRFCGECGFDLKLSEVIVDDINIKQENTTDYANDTNTYFREVNSFIKNVILTPDKLVATKTDYRVSITLGSLGIISLLASFLTALFSSKLATVLYNYSFSLTLIDVPIISATITLFIMFAVLLACFYGLAVLLAKILGGNLGAKEVLTYYSTTSIITLAIYILAIVFGLIEIPKIFLITLAIAFVLFMFSPLYILLRNTENYNTRFDKFYTSAIYFLVAFIVLTIAITIIDTLFGNDFAGIFNNLSVFDLL